MRDHLSCAMGASLGCVWCQELGELHQPLTLILWKASQYSSRVSHDAFAKVWHTPPMILLQWIMPWPTYSTPFSAGGRPVEQVLPRLLGLSRRWHLASFCFILRAWRDLTRFRIGLFCSIACVGLIDTFVQRTSAIGCNPKQVHEQEQHIRRSMSLLGMQRAQSSHRATLFANVSLLCQESSTLTKGLGV